MFFAIEGLTVNTKSNSRILVGILEFDVCFLEFYRNSRILCVFFKALDRNSRIEVWDF